MKNKVFCTAEIGLNHNGDVELAKRMMKMAKDKGCNAVKFQKRTPIKCVPDWRVNNIVSTPWGEMTYLSSKDKLEFWKDEYDIIDEYSKEIDIEWFASAWDLDSVTFLEQYDCKYNKIASAMLTNNELVTQVAKQQKLTFLSTGLATLDEIDDAMDIFALYECPVVPMHCVALYPCPNHKLNLLMIKTLQRRYRCDVGYSSHSPGVLDKPIGVYLGAKYIEFHITLDRSMWGTDQAASLGPRGIDIVMRDIQQLPYMLGTGKKEVVDYSMMKTSRKMRYWNGSIVHNPSKGKVDESKS